MHRTNAYGRLFTTLIRRSAAQRDRLFVTGKLWPKLFEPPASGAPS
jgi:hypothetical protein